MVIHVDATGTSIKTSRGSHRSRNVRSAHQFQTIFRNKKVFWFVLKLEHLIIPLAGCSLPCWIQQFHLCQILITSLSSKPDTVEGEEGGGIQLTSMSRRSTWGIFYREEKIAGLIVLGLCPWSPEGFANHVNSGADEGLRAPFRQAAVRAPLIIWSGPDCRGAGGALHQTGLGSGPMLSNRIIKTAAYLWAKIDPPLLCICPWQTSFLILLSSSLLSWVVCF